MKTSLPQNIAFTVATVLCFALFPAVQVATAVQVNQTQDSDAEMLEFNFSKVSWPIVIEWYAEQAGLTLESVDQYPEGSFSYVSGRLVSPIEAIDEINHKLRLSDPPKTLLRNRDKLYLVDAGRALPAELVETVAATELDQRGKYETLQVVFDVSGLSMEDIESQLRQRVEDYNEAFFQTYPDTNEIFVRESGQNLRFMRDVISRAKLGGTPTYSSFQLKHISAELFLDQISKIHELDENYRNPDGTLTLLVDSAPGSQRIIIRGTPALIADVKSAVVVFDVKPGEFEAAADDPMTLQQYSVPRDSKETFEVIDRLLFDAGGGARVIQGSETGKITVMGRKADHEIVRTVLGLQDSNNGGFATIQLENGDAGDILLAAQTMLGITAENASDNVAMLANTDRDFIMVRGTPAQVLEAKEIIEELDRKSAPESDGLRTVRRAIPMSPADRDRILPTLGDLWPTMGRQNPFDVRSPRPSTDDGSLFRRGQKVQPQPQPQRLPGANDQGTVVGDRLFEVAASLFPVTALNLSTAVLQSSDEAWPEVETSETDGYKSPKQIQSIPGAPVRVWGTEFGIIIESEDLDAGDDVEFLIDQQVGEESEEVAPTVYQLRHCEASYMKSLLESMYGIDSGGGGGGGGAGLLGGIADNVMGEAGGGMLDSLFGGGGGGGSVSSLEGEITIGIDGRLNYLWVNGATSNDLVLIDAAVDLFDISTPPHNPETAGQIYAIHVNHRDPEEMKTRIENLMPVYFQDAEASGGGGGGGNDAANMMKMMRQLTGGKGGGGETKEVKPRGYIDVDVKTGQLIFMGPKSIFVQVEALVTFLDQPEVEKPRKIVEIDMKGSDGGKMAEIIKNLLGSDKVEIVGADNINGDSSEGTMNAEGNGKKNGDAKSKASKAAADAQAKQQEAARNSFIQAIRAQQGRAGGGRQQGGGGNRGGGGGRRGGGR
jgi:hypothetical protein